MRYHKLTFGDSISKSAPSLQHQHRFCCFTFKTFYLLRSLSVAVTGFFLHPMRRWVGMIYLFSVCVHTGFHSVLFCLTTKICRYNKPLLLIPREQQFFGYVHVELICEHCLRLNGGWHNFFTKGRHKKKQLNSPIFISLFQLTFQLLLTLFNVTVQE